MSLDYPIEIRKIPDNLGGGYMALIPAFGKAAIGDGETPEEAIRDLNESKSTIFELYMKQGKPIPEPEPLFPTLAPPSGKFILRMDPNLHARMIQQAELKNISRNAYAVDAIRAKVDADESKEENRGHGPISDDLLNKLSGTTNYALAA